MSTPTALNAAQKDRQKYDQTSELTTAQLLQHVVNASGRSAFQVSKEVAQFANSDRQIQLAEYVLWKLYDQDRHTAQERSAFLSGKAHWPIAHMCNDQKWNAASEDKVLCDTILDAAGVPVPQALAVFDRSLRHYPSVSKIATSDALREVVLENGGSNIFGKALGGMASFGAFEVTSADKDQITCRGCEPMSYDSFVNDYMGGNAYLIQKKLQNHSDIAPYCSAIATVRMVNLVHADRVENPFAMIKIPQGDNIADNFWRAGNLACDIDVATGTIQTVVQRDGPDLTFLDDHPAHAGFMGMILPHWDRLIEINTLAARTFAPIRYQSTDIAITPNGPVIVELNYGGAFELVQTASGRGFLTDDVRAFFTECGVPLADGLSPPAKAKSKFSLFGKKS